MRTQLAVSARRAWFLSHCLAVSATASACGHSSRALSAPWTTLATDYGVLAVPPGWEARVQSSPEPAPWMFWLSPGVGLLVVVVGVDVAGASVGDTDRWLVEFNAHHAEQPAASTPYLFDSGQSVLRCALREGPKINASCIAWRRGGEDRVATLAYVVNAHANAFERGGGITTLSRIAASGKDLVAWPFSGRDPSGAPGR
jgi:hypothetical protein